MQLTSRIGWKRGRFIVLLAAFEFYSFQSCLYSRLIISINDVFYDYTEVLVNPIILFFLSLLIVFLIESMSFSLFVCISKWYYFSDFSLIILFSLLHFSNQYSFLLFPPHHLRVEQFRNLVTFNSWMYSNPI